MPNWRKCSTCSQIGINKCNSCNPSYVLVNGECTEENPGKENEEITDETNTDSNEYENDELTDEVTTY